MTESRPRIPVTVIAGYLGAGKTTLVNHLLRTSKDRRIGIVVNDFGDLDIDAALIDAAGGEAISLANGCICCSLAEGLHTALAQLRDADPPPDHVLIEASGVALPRSIAAYAGGRGFRLDGVVVVVDAEQVLGSVKDRYVGETVVAQLQSADLFVLNKTDLAQDLAGARDLLRTSRSETPILETVEAALPIEVLVGVGPEVTTRRAGTSLVSSHTDLMRESFTSDASLAPTELQQWVDRLPTAVLRVKGLVRIGSPAEWMQVQGVGPRRRIESSSPAGADGRSRLVVIALPDTKVTSPFGDPPD
jgi:G3E family GTPase